MKKHLVKILIIILIVALIGGGIWFFAKRKNIKPLFDISNEFIVSDDAEILTSKLTTSNLLYRERHSPSETRLEVLNTSIKKLDELTIDLNSYLVLNPHKASKTKNLSNSYSKLIKQRSILITNCNEYITRMSGNINITGTAVSELYNKLFDKTSEYLSAYNACFAETTDFVFNKVYTAQNIKQELYKIYSLGVTNLLSNVEDFRFKDTVLIDRLNSAIQLNNGALNLKQDIDGGEFSVPATKFKTYFNNCNHESFINNFNVYYSAGINLNTETSNEKLAVYYAKQILEI